MATLESRNDLKYYIIERLGYPSIDIELTDSQLDLCIDDAMRYFQMFADVANERQFLIINTKANQEEYEVPNTMKGIIEIINGRIYGINTLFSIENIMYSSGQLYFKNFDLINYGVAMQYIKTLDKVLGTQVMIRYSDLTNTIKIYPTPQSDGTMLLDIFNTITEDQSTKWYNHPWIISFVLAEAKSIWGQVTSKYNINLPGGGTIDIGKLREEGQNEVKELLQNLKDEYRAPPKFFMG